MAYLDFSDLIPGQAAAPAPPQPASAPPASAAPPGAPGAEGVTFDDLIPPPPSSTVDAAKSAGVGLVRGALGLIGAPGDYADAVGNASEWAMQRGLNAVGAMPQGVQPQSYADIAAENRKLSGPGILPTTSDITDAIERHTGPLYQPQTTAGKYAQTVGEFLPGALAMPGDAAVNAVRLGVVPAVASEAAGEATQGTGFEAPARIAAAVASGSLGGAANRLVTPFPTSPERQAMVGTLQQEGIPLTAGQITGSRPLRYAESVLSDTPGAGGRAGTIDDAQRAAFTRAALQRVGIDADNASPDVLAGARSAIGQQFDTLSGRNTATFDPQFGHELGSVLNEYDGMTLPGQQAPVVQNTINSLAQLGGTMPGRQYQAVRSQLDKQARSMGPSNPPLSNALFGIRNALDGAMDRSITPEDQDAWQTARDQWRNWKVIQQAATGAGENAAQGNISPAALRSAAVGQNRGAYATGRGDFADLARAGVGVMSPLPNSGTAPRMAIQHLANMGGAIAGAALGGLTHGAAGGTEGLLAGEAVSPVGPVDPRPHADVAADAGVPWEPGSRRGAAAARRARPAFAVERGPQLDAIGRIAIGRRKQR